MARFLFSLLLALTLGQRLLPSAAVAQGTLVIKSLAEKKVTELPPGQLFCRIESFPTREQAQSAAGAWALVAESAGKALLFTLGPVGGLSAGGTKVAEVGPIPRFDAPQYLLRINAASGAPGSTTPVHSHPGLETFFVLTGAQSVHTPDGVMVVKAGYAEPGHAPGIPMQVLSTGSTDLHALVMFVLDATKPFSSPAKLP
ncbi:cupin domain-containing protein [Caballeronia sp. 15715]|uniref:cupin domain-containing protein n=1 Tax=unclassified Caballeronia TaxID=2646786 RepID=UPI0039E6663E